MNDEKLNKMALCRHLLPIPGGDVVGELIVELRAANKRMSELEAALKIANDGINAVASLIDESYGVDGLHLNGRVAPWRDLLKGGSFESWLAPFSLALAKETGGANT